MNSVGWMPGGLFPACPACGNVVSFREGSCAGMRCKVQGCQFGYATTYTPTICSDPIIYAMTVTTMPADWKPVVVKIALDLDVPVQEAREYRTNANKVLFRGSAPEVFRLREELVSLGCTLRIEPEFPYDVFDDIEEGETVISPDDWIQILGYEAAAADRKLDFLSE